MIFCEFTTVIAIIRMYAYLEFVTHVSFNRQIRYFGVDNSHPLKRDVTESFSSPAGLLKGLDFFLITIYKGLINLFTFLQRVLFRIMLMVIKKRGR